MFNFDDGLLGAFCSLVENFRPAAPQAPHVDTKSCGAQLKGLCPHQKTESQRQTAQSAAQANRLELESFLRSILEYTLVLIASSAFRAPLT